MRSSRPFLFLAFLSLALASAAAQQKALNGIDETHLTALAGTVHPLAQAEYDRGQVETSFPTGRLLLTLARPADHEQALQQFLRDAHNPAAPGFHQWLTPAQFGDRYGALEVDQQLVTAWLESHGLAVDRIASNRSTIEFSGTAAQLQSALHTEIHRYVIDGKTFYANAQPLSIPASISPFIASFAPLNSFPLTSYAAPVGPASYSRTTHRATRIALPDFNLTENSKPFYALAPEDFSTQYDVAPIYTAGITGAGETIGIVGTSNINLALVDAYRTLFKLPASHTQVIVDGTDPGDPVNPNIEAFLDTEVSGSVAPAATVNLYIAGGQPLTNSLELAAMRAVEDNQASVLSVSYGNCEQLIGEAGNQFWNGLWEQAAAQGQTVFVSSGDSGPTTCTLVEANSAGLLTPVSTLSVNGISSTPWNVSVGGTDFYYSDYASGAPSISTLWKSINDSSNGSLKAPLPEQPWDNAFGFNITPFNFQSFTIPSASGGGGVSNCSQASVPPPSTSTTPFPTCISGYPKPAWQNAPGVPNDSARDLPDLSLFAANGPNLTAWPICAEPNDCIQSSTGNTPIFLVGGTSASSPAMAGIMALIDQKYGRQGQANYTLYGLARSTPSVFHDLTLGTNDVICVAGTPCSTPIPGQQNSFDDSFGVYPAAPGYDLASGLGSIDAGKLFTAWDTTAFTPSATTLQLSPASFVHGATAAITVAVTASTGSATPTGNVALTTTNASAALRDNAPLTLANGTASANLSTLPGGTYNLVAQYSGDAAFAASASSPVALTVTPESSTTTLKLLTAFTSNSTALQNPPTLSTKPYGSDFYFSATPAGATSASGLATGSVLFTDGSTSATIPVNVNGVATWSPQVLAVGTHSITAAYSGDASYSASTASPLAITVVKGKPLFEALPDAATQIDVSLGQGVYTAGLNLVVHVLLRGIGFSVPPSGSVTVDLGSPTQTMTKTVTVTPNEYLNENLANAFVTFPAVPAGTYTLTASYSGDTNWNSDTYTFGQNLLGGQTPLVFAATGASPTTTVLTLSGSSVDSSGRVLVTTTVTDTTASSVSLLGTQIGLVHIYGNGTELASVQVTGSASTGSNIIYKGTANIPASVFPLGTLQIVGVYLGGPFDTPSTSAPVPLTVTASDFSLSIAASALAVKTGQTATVPVLLSGPYNVGVPIALTCASPSAAITCAITPGSSTVTGTATATLSISAFTLTPATAALSVPSRPASRLSRRNATAILALVALIILPRRRRYITRLNQSLLLLFIAGSVALGCSGGGSSPSTPPSNPTPTQVNAGSGSYAITVTATSGTIKHTTAITFQIE